MNDGNTALPVSPVSKEEAMTISSMFSKIAESLVQASSLPDELKRVQANLDQLRSDYNAKVIHAEQLDQSLADMREQRNRAENALADSNAQLGEAQRKIMELDSTVQAQADVLSQHRIELANVRRDRDDYGLRTLELEEQVKTWKHRADQGRERLAQLQDLFKPDPEPVPEPNPATFTGFSPVQPAPEPAQPEPTSVGKWEPEPFQGLPPSANPPQTEPARRLYPTDEGYDWHKATDYDPERGQYYQKVG